MVCSYLLQGGIDGVAGLAQDIKEQEKQDPSGEHIQKDLERLRELFEKNQG